jgi:hypothetical protein
LHSLSELGQLDAGSVLYLKRLNATPMAFHQTLNILPPPRHAAKFHRRWNGILKSLPNSRWLSEVRILLDGAVPVLEAVVAFKDAALGRDISHLGDARHLD